MKSTILYAGYGVRHIVKCEKIDIVGNVPWGQGVQPRKILEFGTSKWSKTIDTAISLMVQGRSPGNFSILVLPDGLKTSN